MKRVLLLALVALPLSLATAVPNPAAADEPMNPHGNRDGCVACHLPDRPSLVGPVKPIVQTCRGCHPTADMHPVDIVPRRVNVPEGFPLDEGGRMTCATCHDEPGHGAAEAALPGPWFRNGPYGTTTEFCNTCHQPDELKRVDPHHPRFARDPTDPSCSACHVARPEDGAAPDQSRLRLPPAAACLTCHTGLPHHGAAEHIGRPGDPAWGLPLADGRVTCFTCHNVHDGVGAGRLGGKLPDAMRKAVLDDEWAGLEGATFPGANEGHPPMLREPLEGGALCTRCHSPSTGVATVPEAE